jgi:hypothetical protein
MSTKSFKVASVSSNRNSFGLTGLILIARDGEAWEVGANYLNVKAKGEVISVPIGGRHGRHFDCLGFEIPTPLPHAPEGVVAEVWK